MLANFKTYGIVLLVTMICLILVDQCVAFVRPIFLFPEHYYISNNQRSPRPYIEFAGKPNVLDHNEFGYRWKVEDSSKKTVFKISFFGGSTGYNGEPPIAKLLEKQLSDRYRRPIKIANFSVVSSNHRQHLHNIIETNDIFKPDLIIFYGGYNETAQSAFYDPRPGYPYNYFYRAETTPLVKLLLEASPMVNLIDLIGIKYEWFSLTKLGQIKTAVGVYSPKWKTAISRNYFETLAYANKLSNSFSSSRCETPAKFRAFYQPYKVPSNLMALHDDIRKSIKELPYGFDISDMFDKRDYVYTDIVHLTQDGNIEVADRLFRELISDKNISRCLKTKLVKVSP